METREGGGGGLRKLVPNVGELLFNISQGFSEPSFSSFGATALGLSSVTLEPLGTPQDRFWAPEGWSQPLKGTSRGEEPSSPLDGRADLHLFRATSVKARRSDSDPTFLLALW
jgi:hypothetical protein